MPPNSTHLWAHQLLKSLALMRQHYWRWTLTASSLFPLLILCKQAATWIQPGNEKTTRGPHHVQRGYKSSWTAEKLVDWECEGDNYTVTHLSHLDLKCFLVGCPILSVWFAFDLQVWFSWKQVQIWTYLSWQELNEDKKMTKHGDIISWPMEPVMIK